MVFPKLFWDPTQYKIWGETPGDKGVVFEQKDVVLLARIL